MFCGDNMKNSCSEFDAAEQKGALLLAPENLHAPLLEVYFPFLLLAM